MKVIPCMFYGVLRALLRLNSTRVYNLTYPNFLVIRTQIKSCRYRVSSSKPCYVIERAKIEKGQLKQKYTYR